MAKIKLLQAVFLFATCFWASAWAGESLNCLLVNRVGDGGELKTLTNRQVENGLCLISKQTIQAMADKNVYLRDICLKATMHMMKEFYMRFPGRDAKDTVGKC